MAGFRAAAEEFERVHGRMSNDELRQFKAEWKSANGGGGSPSANPKKPGQQPSKSPPDGNAYVKEAYTGAGKGVAGAARSIGDWLASARDKVSDAVAPGSEQGAENYESGIRGIGDWLSRVGDRMMPGDTHERNRKEDALKHAVERMGNKVNELLSGESRFESLQPDAARKPVRLDPHITLGEKGSPENPIELEPVPDDEPQMEEDFSQDPLPGGVEVMPKEVAAARFSKGRRENPIRLPNVNLPDDRGLVDAPDEGMRTGEVTINVPRRKLAKR